MNNDSMVSRYCADVAESTFDRRQQNRTGDGHLLGSLAGGHIVPGGHPKQIHDLAVTKYTMMDVPYLFLDAQGKRFFDEECTMTSWNLPLKYHCPGVQPVMFRFFDSQFREKYPDFRNMPSDEMLSKMAKTEYDHATKGVYVADSIEELCGLMGIDDPAPFVESIEHYNELCEEGVDTDFGKSPEYMKAIDTPPFYGCRYSPGLAAINGGLAVDGNYQVVDADRNPIPGLFAAGVDAGDICGGVDWTMPGGCSDGHCMNAGRYTVIYALYGEAKPKNACSFDDVADHYRDDDGKLPWETPEKCATAIELW
jgi:fumarate reductase flavoprotein subunit